MASGYPASFKHFRNRQKPLQFRKDGTFRILHITDLHQVSPLMDDEADRQIPVDRDIETMNVIEKCIEQSDPDLVVFGGDNISGYWEEYTYEFFVETIRKIVEPVKKRNIPLAIVFGNHDSEGQEIRQFLRRENHINIYAEYENFRSSYNDEDVYGCGNCALPVLDSKGEKINWNIWLMDSNDYNRDENHNQLDGYASLHSDQLQWYDKKANELKENNGSVPVPAVLFQHICVNELRDIVEECDENADGAFESGNRFFKAKSGTLSDGVMREYPCPGSERNQLPLWVKNGDVVAAFFGHDHVNTFTTEIQGIKLIQTIGSGYQSYGKERGGRIITLHENSRDFDTETIIVDRITNSF